MFKTQILTILKTVKADIDVQMSNFVNNRLKVSTKIDGSIVTEADLYISELFKKSFSKEDIYFYSEEQENGPENFKFPLLILDPIDGTKEFAKGVPECAVSFGVYFSDDFKDPRNFSWIYNFMSREEFSSDMKPEVRTRSSELLGLVSNTEYDKGLYPGALNVKPVGSIAYKLGLLSKGQCDYVVTKRPKNLWDIAAGTHILLNQGFVFYSSSEQSLKIHPELYESIMIWTKPENLNSVIGDISNMK